MLRMSWILRFFIFLLSSQSLFTSGYSQQINSYTVFHVKKLSLGRDVTVGRYVLAYMSPEERIKVRGANPPQRLDIKLQWKQPQEGKPLNISGRWEGSDRKLYIGLRQIDPKPVSSSPDTGLTFELPDRTKFQIKNDQKPGVPEGRPLRDSSLVVIKGQIPGQLSVPLTGEDYIHIYPDLKSLGVLSQRIRIVVSSNHAYQISR